MADSWWSATTSVLLARGLDEGTTWDLFDADGRIVGRIVIPANVALARLTDDALYAVVWDEMNVQFVVWYHLLPIDDRNG